MRRGATAVTRVQILVTPAIRVARRDQTPVIRAVVLEMRLVATAAILAVLRVQILAVIFARVLMLDRIRVTPAIRVARLDQTPALRVVVLVRIRETAATHVVIALLHAALLVSIVMHFLALTDLIDVHDQQVVLMTAVGVV